MTFRQILQQRAKKNVSVKALKKFNPEEIILGTLLTEKTYKEKEASNKYYLKIHNDANKNDVKEAIRLIYNVSPEKINIVSVVSKWRTQRKLVRKAYKKAIVTLSEKDKIEL